MINYNIPYFLEYIIKFLNGDSNALLYIANQANLFGQTVNSLTSGNETVILEFIKRALARMIITDEVSLLSLENQKRFKTAMSKLFTHENYCYWGDNSLIILPVRFKTGELSLGAKFAVGVLNQIGKLFGV